MIANPTPEQLKKREYNRQWRLKNAKKDSDWHKAYYAKHRTRLKKRMREYRKAYYEANPLKTAEYTFRKKYGLSLEDITRMARKQKYLCSICKKRKKLNVDHCHKTGRVRGLLCTSCNTALGAFSDSVRVLKVALQYLATAA